MTVICSCLCEDGEGVRIGCGHAEKAEQLAAELEGRKLWCSKMGDRVGRATAALHQSEIRYGRLLERNEQLHAKARELAQCIEDICNAIAAEGDSTPVPTLYGIQNRLTDYAEEGSLDAWLRDPEGLVHLESEVVTSDPLGQRKYPNPMFDAAREQHEQDAP